MDDLTAIADLFRVSPGELTAEPLTAPGLAPRDNITDTPSQRNPPSMSSTDISELIVEHEYAQLTYDGSTYHTLQRRLLRNSGTSPVTRFLVRISVDRYPGEWARSNRLYRVSPLSWAELNFVAHCEGKPMTWTVKHDRDSFKELYLRFQSADGHQFPIYPGQSTTIEYTYSVGDDKWGQWYQRAVRWPTRNLEVEIRFPPELEAAVWGTETSTTGEAVPLRTPIQDEQTPDRSVFRWGIENPPLSTRYRFEWRFQGQPSMSKLSETEPSNRMLAIGIRQQGDPILETIARPFELPSERDEAERIIKRLIETADQATKLHRFTKGIGLAAPQIGLARSAAIVWLPDQEPLVLLVVLI
jgi:hypothetical protein